MIEQDFSFDSIRRMRLNGTQDLGLLLQITVRGDWRARATALSTIGLIIRADPHAHRRFSLRNKIGGRLRWFREKLSLAGPRGAFVSGPVVNRLQDNSWFVRFAAALALTEFRDPKHAPALTAALGDHFRPVRIGAAAALCASGSGMPTNLPELLMDCAPTPENLGDSTATTACVRQLIADHLEALEVLRPATPILDSVAGPDSWTQFLIGNIKCAPSCNARDVEKERYDEIEDAHYMSVKPFTRLNRTHNLELLLFFAGLAMNLQVDPGGLILDLAGGAGWVSDLLSRFGFRTVTLDISHPLLSIGRARHAAAGLPHRSVVGDMTALPFRSSSVEAVVVVDALHHSSDMRAVLREVSRVLKSGCQFLLAEPGEGHSETAGSLLEMQKHGVREGEIQIAEITNYARAAGFDTIRVLPLVSPTVGFEPAEFERAMVKPVDTWMADLGGHPVRFDEFLTQSLLGHPAMVMTKGKRCHTSLAPHLLRAEIRPELQRRSRRIHGCVTIKNAGDTLWLEGGGGPGTVQLGIQLMSTERAMIQMDYVRVGLPRDVSVGATCELTVDFELPSCDTGYVLKLDMVVEQVCWFSDTGSRGVHLRV